MNRDKFSILGKC